MNSVIDLNMFDFKINIVIAFQSNFLIFLNYICNCYAGCPPKNIPFQNEYGSEPFEIEFATSASFQTTYIVVCCNVTMYSISKGLLFWGHPVL